MGRFRSDWVWRKQKQNKILMGIRRNNNGCVKHGTGRSRDKCGWVEVQRESNNNNQWIALSKLIAPAALED